MTAQQRSGHRATLNEPGTFLKPLFSLLMTGHPSAFSTTYTKPKPIVAYSLPPVSRCIQETQAATVCLCIACRIALLCVSLCQLMLLSASSPSSQAGYSLARATAPVETPFYMQQPHMAKSLKLSRASSGVRRLVGRTVPSRQETKPMYFRESSVMRDAGLRVRCRMHFGFPKV